MGSPKFSKACTAPPRATQFSIEIKAFCEELLGDSAISAMTAEILP